MGLSNEERFEKLAWSIKDLQEHIGDQYSYSQEFAKDYPKLKKLIDGLWPDFLGYSGNSAYWILGGDLQKDGFSGFSLMGAAFESQIPTSKPLDDNDNDNLNNFYSSLDIVIDMLDMKTLINNPTKGAVVHIFQVCENISYALHRYEDDFSKNLINLNITLRNIQGEIFNIMSQDEDFFRAYLIFKICKACIPYSQNDIVTKWVVEQNVHHDLRLHEDMTKDILFHTWRKIQFRPIWANDDEKCKKIGLKAQERMEILLKLLGRRNHYKHEHEKLIKMIVDYNPLAVDKININDLKVHLDNSIQTYEKYYSNERIDDSSYCGLTGNSVRNNEIHSSYHWEELDKQAETVKPAKQTKKNRKKAHCQLSKKRRKNN